MDTARKRVSPFSSLFAGSKAGIPIFGRGFAKDGIMRTIEETLNNIAVEVEVKIILRGRQTHTAVTYG
ncbi:MAG TPA: hypothetical protein VE521_08805 [Nitrososphaera sp.]|jgi:hypothetical protein|nr:hypothetical protein [Nitrososphaera sp.]